jgi:osmotically-inducible protein OsmY
MVSTGESRPDPRRDGARPAADGLEQRIERHIAGRAGGRVRDLRVECADGLVILRGRTRTHHAKQLAQEAACDLIEGPTGLANRIVVQGAC